MSVKVKRRGRAAAASHGEAVPLEVDDPARGGKTITVLRQLRGDPLAKLHAHAQIDSAQYRAGRAFQRDWESAARRRAAAIRPEPGSTAACRPTRAPSSSGAHENASTRSNRCSAAPCSACCRPC